MKTLTLTLALLCATTAIAQDVFPPDHAASEPVPVSAAIMAFQVQTNPPPVYPPIATAARVTGTVMIHAIIDEHGVPLNLQATSGPGMLRGSALEAVRRWRWQPYLLNGQPVAVDTSVAVNFKIDPQTGASVTGAASQPSTAPAPSNEDGPVHIAGGVTAGQVLTRVSPVYPAEARAKHIAGTVILHAVIARDGKIANLNVVSGPAELRSAALDAVSQWTYHPYLLNGAPTEVDTTITVNFNFGGSPPPPPPPAGEITGGPVVTTRLTDIDSKPRGTVRISGGVMAGLLLNKVQPLYPDEARAKHISGYVVLHAVVGKDGAIQTLTAISGPEELRAAALEAVNRWTYKPYTLNGEPVEVDTTITVNFTIGT